MNRLIIILFLALIISCATAREPAPFINVAYQSNATGEGQTGPIPPEFLKGRLRAKTTPALFQPPHDKKKAPEIAISLKAIAKQKNGVRKISLNLQNATIEEVAIAMKEVTSANIVIHPSARNIITANLTLNDVVWTDALAVILKASGLVATVNGEEAIVPGEMGPASFKKGVIMISTFDSYLADHEDQIKAARLSKEIAEKRRSAEEERSAAASIRDRVERTSKSYRLKYADALDARIYLESLYGDGGAWQRGEKKQSDRSRADDLIGAPSTGREGAAKVRRVRSRRAGSFISFSVFKPENMITVTAPKRYLDEISERIQELDVAPKQVYIVSRIVEIQRNFIKELGVQWGGHATRVTNQLFPQTVGVYGGGEGANGQNSAVSLPPGSAIDPVTGEALANPAGAVFGFSLGSVSGTTLLQAKLFALEQAGVSRTLSNPKVTAINGSKAVIKSGKEIPYQSTSGNWGTTVRFKEAVISLSVTPLIIEGGRIRMNIEAKKDEVDTALSVQGAPAIKKKELTTSVIVENGGSAALGGIFVGEEGDFEDRVPWFHKIPIFGSLFKNSRKINNELELLIFITPTIIERG